MIASYDLMLGNWVKDGDNYGEVRCIHLDGVNIDVKKTDGSGISYWVEDPQPIPLTPELMELMKWEYDPVPNGVRWNDPNPEPGEAAMDRRHVKLWGQPFERGNFKAKKGDFSFFNGQTFKPCPYLHELQNMYRWEVCKHLEVSL